MKTSEQLKELIKQHKNEAEALLDENKLEEAEKITKEIEVLKAKLEVQELLDEANEKINNLNEQITIKDEIIADLDIKLEASDKEKAEAMEKFNKATETIAELNAKVATMTPIVEQYNKDQYNNKLNNAKKDYKIKFEKCGAVTVFESEEVQNLIVDTIDEDEVKSSKAKYALSEKLLNALNLTDTSSLSVNDINEPAKDTKNLNLESDEFETVFGFKKK